MAHHIKFQISSEFAIELKTGLDGSGSGTLILLNVNKQNEALKQFKLLAYRLNLCYLKIFRTSLQLITSSNSRMVDFVV